MRLLNPRWFKNGRPLVLYATTEPWKASRAEEELGDPLYPLDSGLVVEVVYGSVLLVYANLDPWRAFREVLRYPPAYVKRLIPVEAHLEPNIDSVVETLKKLVEMKGVSEPVELEVRVRGGCVDEEMVEEAITSIVGRVKRRSRWLLRVDFACPIGVAALVEDRIDRVDVWRR